MKFEFLAGGRMGTVRIDGHDVSKGVSAVNLHASPREGARVELDLFVQPGRIDLDEATILIPAPTRELLVQLGWTPPADGA